MRPTRRTLLTFYKTLSRPTQRIILAGAASLLLHALVLWMPHIELPERELALPPLTAKLEALPKASANVSKPKVKPKAQPAPQAEPIVQSTPELPLAESAVAAASAPAIAEPEPVPPVEIAQETSPPTPLAPPVELPVEPQRPKLPKHARLHFNIYQGEGNFKVGESVHKLEVAEGYYTLKASVQTTGLAGIIKSYKMVQTSGGEATAYVLKPDIFTEEIIDSSGKKNSRAEFDWANNKIRFSSGDEVALPKQAQDILSILYQFPPMVKKVEIITINISTGKKFEEYRFEIMFEETLKTPIGELQTVHLRKLREAHKEGLEIWFAQEYRFLPVKVRYLEPSGKIAAEAIITDIRVSDE